MKNETISTTDLEDAASRLPTISFNQIKASLVKEGQEPLTEDEEFLIYTCIRHGFDLAAKWILGGFDVDEMLKES